MLLLEACCEQNESRYGVKELACAFARGFLCQMIADSLGKDCMMASEDVCLNSRRLKRYVESKNRWRPLKTMLTSEVLERSDCLA